MKIQSLLNPLCRDNRDYRTSASPTPASMPHQVASYTCIPKRQKVPKDAAIFSEGAKIVGHLNYPPYEAGDDENLAVQHRIFRINPMGEIMRKGIRHTPYNSDKKDFMEKTGRDAFEMFQYTYKIPGEEKEYVVVWDYNVGLVRMTPFFKSLKYTKTVPAKALKENPGMKEISYSITGGALVCQGYWVPYQAAKSIAATFCYNIRWALTPVFGNDFPSMCLPPSDLNYAKFLISRDIVQECTDETNRFRLEGASYRLLPPKPSTEIHTPRLHFSCPPWGPKDIRSARPRTSEEESGYCTESDRSDKFLFSPQVSPRSTTWTSVNRSESPASPVVFHSPNFSSPNRCLPPLQRVLPTSAPGGYYHEPLRTKRTHSKVAFGDGPTDEIGRPPTAAAPSDYGSDADRDCGDGIHTKKELDAAEIILQLSAADQALPLTKRTRRGSKY
ncbi:hypothetical protein K458DRAFT_399530 [Lentithecium fluviatile CBS 122367]|uniref:HTH APSES-type domain-containing protein n=1 Tax=Lentithecium fluviatile CBS 122367 TaxID=1168545 RepID=A0A6G1JHY1_9PLEO|nr:hypothetical protein K458DRAFT_399530 [Lentithecium fluviatile CBS 122367]